MEVETGRREEPRAVEQPVRERLPGGGRRRAEDDAVLEDRLDLQVRHRGEIREAVFHRKPGVEPDEEVGGVVRAPPRSAGRPERQRPVPGPQIRREVDRVHVVAPHAALRVLGLQPAYRCGFGPLPRRRVPPPPCPPVADVVVRREDLLRQPQRERRRQRQRGQRRSRSPEAPRQPHERPSARRAAQQRDERDRGGDQQRRVQRREVARVDLGVAAREDEGQRRRVAREERRGKRDPRAAGESTQRKRGPGQQGEQRRGLRQHRPDRGVSAGGNARQRLRPRGERREPGLAERPAGDLAGRRMQLGQRREPRRLGRQDGVAEREDVAQHPRADGGQRDGGEDRGVRDPSRRGAEASPLRKQQQRHGARDQREPDVARRARERGADRRRQQQRAAPSAVEIAVERVQRHRRVQHEQRLRPHAGRKAGELRRERAGEARPDREEARAGAAPHPRRDDEDGQAERRRIEILRRVVRIGAEQSGERQRQRKPGHGVAKVGDAIRGRRKVHPVVHHEAVARQQVARGRYEPGGVRSRVRAVGRRAEQHERGAQRADRRQQRRPAVDPQGPHGRDHAASAPCRRRIGAGGSPSRTRCPCGSRHPPPRGRVRATEALRVCSTCTRAAARGRRLPHAARRGTIAEHRGGAA